jgi:two-component system, NarL family, nitrate/nitrite response regulator NarL
MKLMLVDDEPISNYILKRFLAQIEGEFDVVDFTDSDKAFNNIREFDPRIIFIDLNMPGLSGHEFLERMQQEQLDQKVVVISSSTSTYDSDRISAFSNVLRFLPKPVNRELLLQCILDASQS